MKQGTTPTIRLTTDVDTDFEYYEQIWINVYDSSDMNKSIHRDKSEITIVSKNVIEFTLTQEETLLFDGKCVLEMRVKYADHVVGFKNVNFYMKDAIDKVIM